MQSSPAIEVNGLTRIFRTYKKQPGLTGALKGLFAREYEPTVAVNDINFTIEQGECVGFLGPNGAGKTTTLKMLAGLLHPSAGTATVLGFTPWERKQEYRRQFALLLGQKNQLWWDLPARESLALNGKIYRIPSADFTRRVTELTELLRVDNKLDVMVRELSLGERMKFELIAALLHRPKVLFLDEPTIGLDVVSQETVRDFLRTYNRTSETTILLTSHYMSDIEALCDRTIIINEGALFFDGQLAEIIDRFSEYRFVTVKLPPGILPRIADIPAEIMVFADSRLRLKVARANFILVCRMLLDRHPVEDLEIQDVSAEEVVREIFTRNSAPHGVLESASRPAVREPALSPSPLAVL
ncbi:MAG: ATP-binding cassette domain-containing protein [Chthoniobacterales bacterium]